MRNDRILGILAVTITSVLWGTTGTAATFAPHAGPLAIGAAALGVGGLLQAAIAVRELNAERSLLRQNRLVVSIGALAVAVYPLAFYSSMHLAGVTIGSVISLASAPLASGLLERCIDRTPLGMWWMLAAGLGIVGSALLCFSGTHDGDSSAEYLAVGIGLGLLAGASYASYSWAVHRLMTHSISRPAAMGSIFGGGGILLMPVLCLTGAPLLASGLSFSVAVYMALVPMFIGYVLFGFGLTKVPASTATTITLSEPVVAAVLAALIVGEQLTALGWAGIGLFGVVLLILTLAPQTPKTVEFSAR